MDQAESCANDDTLGDTGEGNISFGVHCFPQLDFRDSRSAYGPLTPSPCSNKMYDAETMDLNYMSCSSSVILSCCGTLGMKNSVMKGVGGNSTSPQHHHARDGVEVNLESSADALSSLQRMWNY